MSHAATPRACPRVIPSRPPPSGVGLSRGAAVLAQGMWHVLARDAGVWRAQVVSAERAMRRKHKHDVIPPGIVAGAAPPAPPGLYP